MSRLCIINNFITYRPTPTSMSILTVGIYFSTSQKQRESEHEMSYITIKNRLKRIIGQKSRARHVTVYVHVNVVTHS